MNYSLVVKVSFYLFIFQLGEVRQRSSQYIQEISPHCMELKVDSVTVGLVVYKKHSVSSGYWRGDH